jgi:Uma2 family endonuclease
MKKMGEPALKKDRIYTYGDYRNWPEDERWELIEGTAWNMSPAPNRYHQKFLTNFLAQLAPVFEGHPCEIYAAPLDVLLPDFTEENDDDVTTVVQPDISVICDRNKLTDKGCTGAPDWIIEILSPSTLRKDSAVKFDLYERHKVKEYWIVDPGSKTVQVYILDDTGKYPESPRIYTESELIRCTAVEGLTVDLNRVFAEG